MKPKIYFTKKQTPIIKKCLKKLLAAEFGEQAEYIEGFEMSRERIGKEYFYHVRGKVENIYRDKMVIWSVVSEVMVKLVMKGEKK